MNPKLIFLTILAASASSATVDEKTEDSCRKNEWMCWDRSCIASRFQCDGVVDCEDASDENVDACRQSIYVRSLAIVAKLTGAYKQNSLLEGTKFIETLTGAGIGANITTLFPQQQTSCILPDYPLFGTYNTNILNAKPGEAYNSVTIDVICKNGYGVEGSNVVKCQNGVWLARMPVCVSQCRLRPHPSVKYSCIVSGAVIGYRNCSEFEPFGTVVMPECRSPDFYSQTTNQYMRCNSDGKWDYVAKCVQECGTVTASGLDLIFGGRAAKKAEVPWHAGIYTKIKQPYQQICGGSLISSNVIISAAHCFWDEFIKDKLPAKEYSVAVGKRYRPWSDTNDQAQKSDVMEYHLPDHFQGSKTHFQSDISVIITAVHFKFNSFIRPICVDFNVKFEKIQLQPGEMGKVAGWGLTSSNGEASQVLQVVELPFVTTGKCIDESPERFVPYISGDKICAGFKEVGKAVCKGDSGGGLAFPAVEKGTKRYYLRGIVSTAPSNDYDTCNAYAYTAFTQLQNHEHFIKEHWTAEDVSSTEAPLKDNDISRPQEDNCVLPPYPAHGVYVTNLTPDGKPGEAFNFVVVNITCRQGYGLNGSRSIFCINGRWSEKNPHCLAQCRLKPHPSVVYRCLLQGAAEGFRSCGEYELTGAVVSPQCKAPQYYSPNSFPFMHCIDGNWDYVAKCQPECGTVTPGNSKGTRSMDTPWHAVFYKKINNKFEMICEGSLVMENVVLSAASCFWMEESRSRASIVDYAVAVGKKNSSWEDNTAEEQRSDVKAIHLADRYQGRRGNFESNIAVVVVKRPFKYNIRVRPVCLDFNVNFERRQLRGGRVGSMAGWPRKMNDFSSQNLRVTELPYIEVANCLKSSQSDALEFITSDKFCGGSPRGANNDTACIGSLGNGLAFPESERGVQRFYLRGVLSTVLGSESGCPIENSLFIFTQLLKHELFIKESMLGGDNERPTNNTCILPEYPAHGRYSTNVPGAKPGDYLDTVILTVTCDSGYALDEIKTAVCFNGFWAVKLPTCLPQCQLNVDDPSVDFRCLAAGASDNSTSGRLRPCRQFEESGTVVSPQCRSPYFYSPAPLPFMRCTSGNWDYVAKCLPECGTLTVSNTTRGVADTSAERVGVPWHAAIYTKSTNPYTQICGGTIVSNRVVITAASCFWKPNQGLESADKLLVVVGKQLYLDEDSRNETQRSNVQKVELRDRFQGNTTNYEDNIAVVTVAQPFVFRSYIRPMCMNFDILRKYPWPGENGKVAGWGGTAGTKSSQALKLIDVDYVSLRACSSKTKEDAYLTNDMMCGTVAEAGLCAGDMGSGLASQQTDKGQTRFYLRGVLISVPKCAQCFVKGDAALFTPILLHERFIVQFII